MTFSPCTSVSPVVKSNASSGFYHGVHWGTRRDEYDYVTLIIRGHMSCVRMTAGVALAKQVKV
jgi:hypothetical protein